MRLRNSSHQGERVSIEKESIFDIKTDKGFKIKDSYVVS